MGFAILRIIVIVAAFFIVSTISVTFRPGGPITPVAQARDVVAANSTLK